MPVSYQGSDSIATATSVFRTRVATTANIAALAGGAPTPVDGVNLAAGDRVLVKNQAAATQNGIYTVATVGGGANGTWIRSTDFDQNAEVVSGILVTVSEGALSADSLWMLTTNDPITVGVTGLTFGILTLGGGLTGAGVAGEAAFFNAASNVISDPNFKWDNTNKRLGLALGVGTPNSSFENGGSVSFSKETVIQANYNVLSSDYQIAAVLGNIAATLPLTSAAGVKFGKRYLLYDANGFAAAGNPISFTASGAETIDGLGTQSIIIPFGSMEVMARTGVWKII